MSKKSRKRNKRILAVLGVGAAAAMAAKKKRDAVISDGDKNDGGFRKKAKSEPRGPQELGLSTAKKDTAVKTKKMIPQNTKVNTGEKDKDIRMTSANVQSKKIDAPYKGIFNFGDGVAKRRAEEKSFNEKYGRKKETPTVTGTTKPGQPLKSGGRAGYKSGGSSVKKSMGKALRGGGKVMR